MRMHDQALLVREAVLDAQWRPCAYDLRWQGGAGLGAGPLLDLLPQLKHDPGQLLLRVGAAELGAPPAQALAPGALVLRLPDQQLDAGARASLQAWREQGAGACLGVAALGANPGLLSLASHVELDIHGPLERQARAVAAHGLQALAGDLRDWGQAQACVGLKLPFFAGALLAQVPRQGSKSLNASQVIIAQAMDMVSRNADARELESVLRRDAALSFRLLRYINSAGFGLGVQVQSLRHAVTLLGYNSLKRWLALLLASSGTGNHAQALIQYAACRGRMAELLGERLLGKREAEELFMAGMFSLLDRQFMLPMEAVLEKIQLPEAVCEALLGRGGVYGPFLRLVEACEDEQADGAALADALFISTKTVNEIHLDALGWSRTLQ